MEGNVGSFLSVISENMSRKSLTLLDPGVTGTSFPAEVSSWISDVDIVCCQYTNLEHSFLDENASPVSKNAVSYCSCWLETLVRSLFYTAALLQTLLLR